MLRLRVTEVELIDGEAYYGGGLFSGMAFEERDGVFLGARVFEEGVDVGEYRSPYLEVPAGSLRVTIDHAKMTAEPDMETVKFHGSPFEGVLYTLQGQFCLGEAWYADGWSQIDIEYHFSGLMSSYEEYRNQTGGRFSFDPSGEMAEASIVKGANDRLKASFSPGRRLTTLDVSGEVLRIDDEVVDGLPFASVSRTADLADVQAHDELCLLGDAVDGEVLAQLIANDGLANTRTLELYKTPLEPGELASLKTLPLLERLVITDKDGKLLSALTALKVELHELEVIYNNVALAASLESEADPPA